MFEQGKRERVSRKTHDELEGAVYKVRVAPSKGLDDPPSDLAVDRVEQLPTSTDLLQALVLAAQRAVRRRLVQRGVGSEGFKRGRERLEGLDLVDGRPCLSVVLGEVGGQRRQG